MLRTDRLSSRSRRRRERVCTLPSLGAQSSILGVRTDGPAWSTAWRSADLSRSNRAGLSAASSRFKWTRHQS